MAGTEDVGSVGKYSIYLQLQNPAPGKEIFTVWNRDWAIFVCDRWTPNSPARCIATLESWRAARDFGLGVLRALELVDRGVLNLNPGDQGFDLHSATEGHRAEYYEQHKDDLDLWEDVDDGVRIPENARKRGGLTSKVTVRFEPEDHAKLCQLAKSLGLSYSDTIREAVHQAFEQLTHHHTDAEINRGGRAK